MDMITQVFTHQGQRVPIRVAFARLVQLRPQDPYKNQKAAGALGGASNSGFIKRAGNHYRRTR